MLAQFIPNPFYPVPLCWVPAIFFAIVFFGVFLLLRLLAAWFLNVNYAKTLAVRWIAPASLGLLAVYSLYPKLYEYSDVVRVARPGVNIQSVIDQLGTPSERSRSPDGFETYFYNEGIMTGGAGIDVDPDGVILQVYYVD